MIKTKKIKIRPESYKWLNAAAKEVNFIWNWANETSHKALNPFYGKRKYLSGYDLMKLASGASSVTNYIGSDSIGLICAEYARKRNQFKKIKLKWRVSGGAKKSLGWIPLKPLQMAKRKANGFRFAGKVIRLFESIEGYNFKQGCFAQDSIGDWYLCIPYEFSPQNISPEKEAVGIDLGLKSVATCSDGIKLEHKFYKQAEQKIAQLQKRGHKKQAKFLHRKIKRQRANAVHNFTTSLVRKYNQIYIGDLSFKFLKGGRKAKSAYDGAIGMLKTQLEYKGQQAARWVKVISEKYTTQACSNCGSLSGPAGWTGLVERDWKCTDCGVVHDRDINSAVNILNLGMKYHPPFAGTSRCLT